MAGSFLKSIERAKAATQTTRPAEKPVAEMNDEEMNEALRQARVEAIEANRALAQAVAEERNQPPATLAATLAELQRGRRNHWR